MAPRKLPDDQTLSQFFASGYRFTEIARWYKCSSSAVRNHARRLGEPPRKRGGNNCALVDRPNPMGIPA